MISKIRLIIALISLIRDILRLLEKIQKERADAAKVQEFANAVKKACESNDTSDLELMLSRIGK